MTFASADDPGFSCGRGAQEIALTVERQSRTITQANRARSRFFTQRSRHHEATLFRRHAVRDETTAGRWR